MRWNILFSRQAPNSGANQEALNQFTSRIFSPLSQVEICVVREIATMFLSHDVSFSEFLSQWYFPSRSLPYSYLSFLAYANGGLFIQGDRILNFLSMLDVRSVFIHYMFPYWMPLAVPFATDHGGGVYCFDLRTDSVAGEHPVIYTHFGSLGYNYDQLIALNGSFIECCQDSANALDVYTANIRHKQ